MGYTLDCEQVDGTRRMGGKAMLESDTLEFRGQQSRTRVYLKDITDVVADQGILSVTYAFGVLHLDLGEQAARWAQKLKNPPSRLDKLGIRQGDVIQCVGEFPDDFRDELRAADVRDIPLLPMLILYSAETTHMVHRLPPLGSAKALWVVYPKKTVHEKDVLQAGRSAGLTDVKVMRFSPTHTALKFTPRKKPKG